MRGQVNLESMNYVDDFDAMKYWSFPSSYTDEKKKETMNMILNSGDYIASIKKDGYFQRIIKDMHGDIFMCSRNKGVNGVVEKHEWVPHFEPFFKGLPNGTVLLGEVYLENKTSKNIVSILGCLKDKAIERQKKDEDKLKLFIFDILALDGQECWNLGFEKRIQKIDELTEILKKQSVEQKEEINKYIKLANFYNDPKLIKNLWLSEIAKGGEGVVLIHKDYPYEFKKRKVRKTLKLKKELEETIDVFLTGRYKESTRSYTGKEIESWEYWYNNITEERVQGALFNHRNIDGFEPVTKGWFNGWAGSVEIAIMREGKVFPIGYISNVTEDIKQGIANNSKEYFGKVAELTAMEIDRSGTLPTFRHAKIVRWRDDKGYEDCDWSQLW